ncbi:hypothetical protein, partial [Kineococcus sp. SYSU DK005]|uniref:hypothetical protein n=1 Tax=Kineococcus sp. SYSU DK005 TaxID=3383126 RepID=UPI003D7EEFEA
MSELCLLGVVAALACAPVLTAGAVVATLSGAVGRWADTDELPGWSWTAREFARRLLPGAAVSAAGALAVLLLVRQQQWLRAGLVPGGQAAAAALLAVSACLAAVVLLAVPRLAEPGVPGWRAALAGGWGALRRAPLAGPAALAVTAVAAALAVLLPGAVLLLPALWVLGLHAVHRVLVRPREAAGTSPAAAPAAA